MFSYVRDGLRAAWQHPKLVFLIWAWYGLLALVPAMPLWATWNTGLGSSIEAQKLLQRYDIGILADLSKYDTVGTMGVLTMAMAALMLVAFVSSAFMMGGILEVVATDGELRSFMHRFYRGGGHFFWRFLRLALIAGVCVLVVGGVLAAALGKAITPLTNTEWEMGSYLWPLALAVVVAIVGGGFLLALDYARIRVARDGDRGMLRAYFRGLGFVLRHAVTAYGMAITILVMLVALVLLYVAHETNRSAGTWGAIAVLILAQQIVVLGRVGLRVSLVAGERAFFLAAAAPVPAPPRVVYADADPVVQVTEAAFHTDATGGGHADS